MFGGNRDRTPHALLSLGGIFCAHQDQGFAGQALDFARFVAQVTGSHSETAQIAAVYCGLRRGEVVGLDWKYIDMANRSFAVRQQVQRVLGKVQVTPPKAGGVDDQMTMNESVYQSFARLWEVQGRPTAGLLYRNDKGGPLEPMRWYRDFKAQLVIAGLPNLRGHDLRHTAATRVVNITGSLKDAAQLLRHASTKHTERYARRLNMDRKRQTVAPLEGVVSETTPMEEVSGKWRLVWCGFGHIWQALPTRH